MARRRGRPGPTGTVWKRKDTGKYVIDYRDNLGKRHVETAGTNQNDAKNFLHDRLTEIKEGTFNPDGGGIIFKDYARHWLKGKLQVKPSTRVAYEGIVENHLIPYFEKARLIGINRAEIQKFIGQKVNEKRPDGTTASPKTLKNMARVLHQILEDALVEGILPRNPYKKIETPKVVKRTEPDPLEPNEIKLFLDSCDKDNHALFYTAIFSGVRRGELVALKWGDIDWVGNGVHVRRSLYRGRFQTPKSKYSIRKVDMGPRLAQVLKGHRAAQNKMRLKGGKDWVDSDLVFCGDTGRPLNPDNLYHRDFQRILQKSQLRRRRIHDLRHTYASILISAGHNPKYIQEQMGHSSITVTMDLYGHLMKVVHEGAARKSEDFVFNAAAESSSSDSCNESATNAKKEGSEAVAMAANPSI